MRTLRPLIVCVSGAIFVTPVGSAFGQSVLYVDATRLDGLNDGSSWNDAFLDLQDAMDNAATNGLVTEVRVAGGVYRPDRGTGDRSLSFRLMSGLALRGGYAGADAPDPQVRDFSAHPSVLCGDLFGDDDTIGNTENAFHVVEAGGVNATAVLDGFVARGGNADGTAPYPSGGGLRNAGGRPTVTNCKFIDNAAAQDGGAVYNGGGGATASFTDCVFLGNSAGSRGGAVFNDNTGSAGTRVLLSGCLLSENAAFDGGALYQFGGGVAVLGCTFESNVASAEGGAAFNFTSEASYQQCRFRANSASDGGAMRNSSSRPVLVRCTFVANTALDDGGAVFNQSAGASITHCAFVGNLAAGDGGAVWSFNTLAFPVRNCTFSGNVAGLRGGALYNWGTVGGGSGPQVASCILWDNRDSGGPDESGQMHTDRGSPTLDYSCLQGFGGTWGGPGNIGANPRLLPDGIHLRTFSPCIDRGDPMLVFPGDETDLDGEPRVYRGRVDMGADEAAPPLPPPSSLQPIE